MPSGGGSGSSSGQVLLPPNQAGVANDWANLMAPFTAQSQNALDSMGGISPAQAIYPQANTYTSAIQNNPFADQSIYGAQNASDLYLKYMLPSGFDASRQLGNMGQNAADLSFSVPGQAMSNPAYGQAADYGTSQAQMFQPRLGQALDYGFNSPGIAQAGDQAPAISRQLTAMANQAFNYGASPGGIPQAEQLAAQMAPQFQMGAANAVDLGSNVPNLGWLQNQGIAAGNAMTQAGQSILGQAFDPQQALFNRTQSQVMDQAQAALNSAGLGSSPYGASVMGGTAGNLNIDWQNQQLQREMAGTGAAGSAFGQAAQDVAMPGQYQAQIMGQGANIANLLGQGAGQLLTNPALAQGQAMQLGSSLGANLLGQGQSTLTAPDAARMAALQGGAGAANTMGAQQLSALLDPARAQLQGLLGGTEMLSQLDSAATRGFGGQASMLQNLAQLAPQLQGAPYDAYNQVANNNLAALQQQLGFGNQQYQVPQAAFSNMMKYLGLGQDASKIDAAIQNQQFNQESGALFGAGSLGLQGINALGGRSLFGGASAAPGLAAAADISGPLGVGIGGDMGLADTLASAAPFALSA